jgi:hypothetical protein
MTARDIRVSGAEVPMLVMLAELATASAATPGQSNDEIYMYGSIKFKLHKQKNFAALPIPPQLSSDPKCVKTTRLFFFGCSSAAPSPCPPCALLGRFSYCSPPEGKRPVAPAIVLTLALALLSLPLRPPRPVRQLYASTSSLGVEMTWSVRSVLELADGGGTKSGRFSDCEGPRPRMLELVDPSRSDRVGAGDWRIIEAAGE